MLLCAPALAGSVCRPAVPERVVSVNVRAPAPVPYRGRAVQTGVVKAAVEGRVRLGAMGFEGDGQADVAVHGGPDRAAYLYSADDLAWWAEQLRRPVPPRTLGEDLAVTGLGDDEILVDDLVRSGTPWSRPRARASRASSWGSAWGTTDSRRASGRRAAPASEPTRGPRGSRGGMTTRTGSEPPETPGRP